MKQQERKVVKAMGKEAKAKTAHHFGPENKMLAPKNLIQINKQ